MTGITWSFNFGAKGGQTVKEKKDETVITDKNPDLSLKIKIKGNDDTVEEVLTQIAEKIGNINECTVTFSGKETALKSHLKEASKIIATAGGQETLDCIFGEEKKKEKITN